MLAALFDDVITTSNRQRTCLHFDNRGVGLSYTSHYQSPITALSPQKRLENTVIGREDGNLLEISFSDSTHNEMTPSGDEFCDLESLLGTTNFSHPNSLVLHTFDSSIVSLICSGDSIMGILSCGDIFIYESNCRVSTVQISGHIVSRLLQPTCLYLCSERLAKSRLCDFLGSNSTDNIVFVGISDGSIRYVSMEISPQNGPHSPSHPSILSLNSVPYSLNRCPITSIFATSPTLRADMVITSPTMPSSVSLFQICAVHSDYSMSIYTHFNNSTSSLKGNLVHLPLGTDCRSVICWEGLIMFLCRGTLWAVFIEQKSDISLPSLSEPARISPSHSRYVHAFHVQDKINKSLHSSGQEIALLVLYVGDEDAREYIELIIRDRPAQTATTPTFLPTSLTWHQAYSQQCRKYIFCLQTACSPEVGISDSVKRDVVGSIRDALSETSASFEAEKCLANKISLVDCEIVQTASLVKMLQNKIWPGCLRICLHFEPSVPVALDLHTFNDSNSFAATLTLFTSSELCLQALQDREVNLAWSEECHFPILAPGSPSRVVSNSTAKIHFIPYARNGVRPHPTRCSQAYDSLTSSGFICQLSLQLPITKPIPHSLEVCLHVSTLHLDVLQSCIVEGVREYLGTRQHVPEDLLGMISTSPITNSATDSLQVPWGLLHVQTAEILAAVRGTHVATIGSEIRPLQATTEATAASQFSAPGPRDSRSQDSRYQMMCEYMSQICPQAPPPSKYSLSYTVPTCAKEFMQSVSVSGRRGVDGQEAATPWNTLEKRVMDILHTAELSTGGWQTVKSSHSIGISSGEVGLSLEYKAMAKLQALAGSNTHRLVLGSLNDRAAFITTKVSRIKVQEPAVSTGLSIKQQQHSYTNLVPSEHDNELIVLSEKSNSRLLLCLLQSELRNEAIVSLSSLVSDDAHSSQLIPTDRDIYSLPTKLQQVE